MQSSDDVAKIVSLSSSSSSPSSSALITQQELEQKARYIVATGLYFSDDFFVQSVSKELMTELDMTGAYVIRMKKPLPSTFITFGASPGFIADAPCTRYVWVTRTEAENMAIANFMEAINPKREYPIKVVQHHIDLVTSEGVVVRRPTDEEIAMLHIRFREYRYGGSLSGSCKRRMERELRALDRRRFRDANIAPPPERASFMKKLEKFGIYSSTFWATGQNVNKLPQYSSATPYRSESSDEELERRKKSLEEKQRSEVIKYMTRDLFGSSSSEEEVDDVDVRITEGAGGDDATAMVVSSTSSGKRIVVNDDDSFINSEIDDDDDDIGKQKKKKGRHAWTKRKRQRRKGGASEEEEEVLEKKKKKPKVKAFRPPRALATNSKVSLPRRQKTRINSKK